MEIKWWAWLSEVGEEKREIDFVVVEEVLEVEEEIVMALYHVKVLEIEKLKH